MNNRFMINYTPGDTPLHRLNGATKVFGFVVITVYIIMSFDVRVMLPAFVLCVCGVVSLKPRWKPVMFMLGFLTVTAGVFGTLMIILIRPASGYGHVGAENIIYRFSDNFYLAKELLWYTSAMFFKRLCSFSSAILFILSITPSELAAGLNALKLPYKLCTLVSLAFRTIPDVARDYADIKNSLMMRGAELDPRKAGPGKRVRQTVMILAPLIITSFGRVSNIANAMDLRGYGKLKERSWYSEREPDRADWIARGVILALAAFSAYYIVFHRIINPPPFDYWCPWVNFN